MFSTVCGSLAVATAALLAAPQSYPPELPDGKRVVTETSEAFLNPAGTLREGTEIARSAPTIDFLYYPGQTYPGNPWSVWGDGLAVEGKYYSSIGDHKGPDGNAFVYAYDPADKTLRRIVDVRRFLDLPDGHYTPGKIHSRIDLGRDGWLYFSTHRGSTRVTTDQYHYKGDWILRHNPASGKTEIVVQAPVEKHCIPSGLLDPERLIFYGGTASGNFREKRVLFFAYDCAGRKLLCRAEEGPYRYLLFARSTGRVYYTPKDGGPLMRFDPSVKGPPVKIEGALGLRSATQETPQGFVYTVSTRPEATLWRFDVRTEKISRLDTAAVASQTYITSLDADPTGRYLYYIPGAHGGAERDGTPVVQYDVKTGKKKVIAFLHPFFQKKYGYTFLGTFASAVDPSGERLYITWNGNRAGPDARGKLRFDTCALTILHIPESERRP